MQETDIIGGTNPNREIYDNRSGGFSDLKNIQKKAVFLRFSERSEVIENNVFWGDKAHVFWIGKSTGKMAGVIRGVNVSKNVDGVHFVNYKSQGNCVTNASSGNISVKEFVTNVTYTCNHTDAVAGRVTDAITGEPIHGATVTAAGYSQTTDADGKYIMSTVVAGTYTITATKAGYSFEPTENVLVSDDKTAQVDFKLTDASTGF